MLEWMRLKIKGIIIWTIISVIAIVFFLGTGDFLLNRNFNNTIIAKVNGQIINIDTINSIYNAQIKQQHANKKSYNKFDLDPNKIKHQITLNLINQSAITTQLQNSGFIINNDHIIQMIKLNPDFQENGVFSLEKYNKFFKLAPFTELQYQQFLKEHLLQEQLHNSLLLSSILPAHDVQNFITTWQQQRDFGFVIIPFKNFINSQDNLSTINDQAIENYYHKNQASLIHPETVTITYLDIAKDKFLEQISVEKTDLMNYYQEHLNYYTVPELVNIKHILITKTPNDETAKTKAEEIFTKLQQGQDFTTLAKQYSQDQNTAPNGGNLGWVAKGETEPNFETAAFSLNKTNDLSNIIQSSFGYHIIKLNDKREAKIKSFEEVLNQVTEHYKEELAQHKLHNIIEELENNSLENEDLINLANKFNLTTQTIGPFTSKGEPQGILSYNEVVITAFDKKYFNKNSNLIKLTDDRFILLKTIARQPSKNKTLQESYNEIKAILQTEQAMQLAKKQGLALAIQLLNNHTKTPTNILKPLALKWNLVNKATRNIPNINQEILKAAFSVTTTKPQKTISLNNGDFAIVQLIKVHDNNQNLSPQAIDQFTEQLIALQAQIEQKSFEQDLINKAKIKIFKEF